MTPEERELIAKMGEHIEQIGKLIGELGATAGNTARTFADSMAKATKEGIWPPYDH